MTTVENQRMGLGLGLLEGNDGADGAVSSCFTPSSCPTDAASCWQMHTHCFVFSELRKTYSYQHTYWSRNPCVAFVQRKCYLLYNFHFMSFSQRMMPIYASWKGQGRPPGKWMKSFCEAHIMLYMKLSSIKQKMFGWQGFNTLPSIKGLKVWVLHINNWSRMKMVLIWSGYTCSSCPKPLCQYWPYSRTS